MTLIAFNGKAQTGINTINPKATLHIKADDTKPNQAVGVIAPLLTGNQLKAKDNYYNAALTGTIVYVTSAANPTSTKTENVNKEGYYYFNGRIWKGLEADLDPEGDATRFLGGTVYVYFDSMIGYEGSLSSHFMIGGYMGYLYNLGTHDEYSQVGGIQKILGNGYRISNPSQGIFDIEFDTPLEEIYGISVNIYDTYPESPSFNPQSESPGGVLKTTDNTQVAYISNRYIRIKTGDSTGELSNRSFTFLVTGR